MHDRQIDVLLPECDKLNAVVNVTYMYNKRFLLVRVLKINGIFVVSISSNNLLVLRQLVFHNWDNILIRPR